MVTHGANETGVRATEGEDDDGDGGGEQAAFSVKSQKQHINPHFMANQPHTRVTSHPGSGEGLQRHTLWYLHTPMCAQRSDLSI